MTNGQKRDGLSHRFLSKLYIAIHRLSPRAHYWLYSFYQPIKRFFFVLRYPNLPKRGPKVLLVRGEEGPDKLWSYISVYAVYRALREVFDVELLVYASFRKRHIRRIVNARPDLVSLGDDSGRFQEMFEKHNVPFMGSDSETCRTCYDKIKAKRIVSENGIATPPWLLVKTTTQLDSVLKEVSLPVVVKPRMGGSSVGVCKGNTKEQLNKALMESLKSDQEAVVEKYISGKEFTCTVYGNEHSKTLPIYRRIMRFEIQEMAARGEKSGRTRYPVMSDGSHLGLIQNQSIALYRIFNCRDMIRTDWKYDEKSNELYFLEINILPWLQDPGFIGEGAQLIGSSYEEFMIDLFKESIARQRKRGLTSYTYNRDA